MNKYIQDSIRNNLRSIINECTVPQKKAISEITRGLFTAGKPVLNALVQDETKTVKKQAEKYAKHLGNVKLKDKVDDFAFRQAKKYVRKTTVIAYDLSDISKECAKKMEKISRVFDGSKRQSTNGYTLHGVGINNVLVKNEIHDSNAKTLNQVRRKIVQNISEKLNKKGIWVFDRGNDDKQFFKDMRHNLEVDFICRLKENRQVAIVKTGELIKIKDLPAGKYDVFLMQTHNPRADTSTKYTLIIDKHLKNNPPIRLISNLSINKFSAEQFVNMYLERWGIENIFKRIKTKFELESIRVLKYQRFENLVSLIQFAVVVSTIIFYKIQQTTNTLIIGVLMFYKKFIKHKNITFNIDSFIGFMRCSLKPLIIKKQSPGIQLNLFSKKRQEKLGVF